MTTLASDTAAAEATASHEEELLRRIKRKPGVCGGRPTIRGMRFAVEHVLNKMAGGWSVRTLLEQYDSLEPEDIQACLLYAERVIEKQGIRKDRGVQPAA